MPAQTRTASRAEFSKKEQQFCDLLEQVAAWHHSTLARRGSGYLGRVGAFEWNARLGELTCPVQGRARRPYTVTFEFQEDEFDPQGFAGCICTCPYSGGLDACKHTYAATLKLLERLRDPRDPIREQLFGGRQGRRNNATLEILDDFLRRQREQARVAETEPATRLIYRVSICLTDPDSPLDIAPYEQKISKTTGRWTKGRKVSWERFAAESELLKTPADRKLRDVIARGIERPFGFGYRYPYGYHTFGLSTANMIDALRALVGHPFVFGVEKPDQTLEIANGELGLAVRREGQALRLVPTINGENSYKLLQITNNDDDPVGIIAVHDTEPRIVVAGDEPETIELATELMQHGRPVPKKQQTDLLERLAGIQAVVPLSLPEDLRGEESQADGRIRLRLTPTEPAGLTAELKVRPGETTSLYDPGHGPPQVAGVREGKQLVLQRQLDEEARRAAEIVSQLSLDRHWELDRGRWRIADDEDALELLVAIQELDDDDLIVEWPDGKGWSVSRPASPAALRVEIEDRQDWFGLSGSIEIDGEQVPLSQILSALRKGQRFVPLGPGRWARLTQALRQRLAQLDDVVHETRGRMELDLTAAPVVQELVDDDSVLKASRRWKETLERLESASNLNPEPPVTLAAELRDYQLEGFRWMRRLAEWGVGACLADDMGLGKTVQTLAVLVDRMEEGPALVVAPTSVGFNWARETERFAPTLRPILYHESDRDSVLAELSEGDVLIASYGLLQRDIDRLSQVSWGTFVLDEAQRIKNSQTKTARASRQIDAKWSLALTGTPLENHLGEFWSIFRTISPGLLGSWERFKERFAEPIERQRDASRRRALAHLARPFLLRRTKGEVLDELPSRTEINRAAELSEEERRRYDEARLRAVAELVQEADDGDDQRFQVLAALTRLRQLSCHPGLVDESWTGSSAKLELFLEIVEELREGGHRALVFSQFTQHLALLRKALEDRGVLYEYLDGQTPVKERVKRVDSFQAGHGEMFLISLKAGGAGLNLTGADYVIHMDPWWNPAVEDQATDRAHRIGQTRPVTVYRLVAKDTIEEQILALHADKRQLVAGVLDGADVAGKLSTQELVNLIRGEKAEAADSSDSATMPRREAAPNSEGSSSSGNGRGPRPRGAKRKTAAAPKPNGSGKK